MHTAPARLTFLFGLMLASAVLLASGSSIAQADTAPDPNAYDAGLSQVTNGATPLSAFEKQALACRNTASAQALLTVGAMTAQDRQLLGIGSSPANDWCVFLEGQKTNSGVDTEHLNPGFGQCLMKFIIAADASGNVIRINSAYRSDAKQAVLYQQALQKYGSASIARKWVAPPGGSMHNKGLAADITFDGQVEESASACSTNPACVWAHASAPAFGLNFRLSNEAWHIEPAGTACETAGAAPTVTASSGQGSGASSAVSGITSSVSSNAGSSALSGVVSGISSSFTPTIGTSAYAGIQASGVLGNLLTELTSGTVGTTTGQIIGSVLSHALIGNGSTLFGNTAPGNTNAGVSQVPTEYMVISEDGILLGESMVSAMDALAKAGAYYNADITASSSQAHLAGSTIIGGSGTIEDPYQLSDGTSAYLTSNTFPAETNSFTAGTSTFATNGANGFVQTFITGIFSLLGAAFGNLLR